MDTSNLKTAYESERENLNSLCDKWQHILDTTTHRKSQNEDVKGSIMSVLGQTRLLLNQKLKQFEQLMNESDEKQVLGDMPPITLTDLEGFWELVMIQVNDVHAKFDKLEEMNFPKKETKCQKPPRASRRDERTVKPSQKFWGK